MAISMRAIKTFSGRPGESRRAENLVMTGDDFNTDQRRADYLERAGLAVPLIAPRAKTELPHQNKMEPTLANKAADAGPLPSTGGPTGEQRDAFSLSAQDRAPAKRGSRRSKDDAE